MVESRRTETEKIRKLRLMRSMFMEEGRLHEFLRDAYAGTGGFRNGQVPSPAITFWGIRSYERGYAARDSWWNLYLDTRKAFNDRKPGQPPGPAKQSWSYIQPFPGEDNFTYLDRVNNSNYVNNVQPIVRVTNSFLTKEDAQREHLPDELADWLKSVTPDGKHIREHAKNVCWRGQLVGWCATLVDLPRDVNPAAAPDADPTTIRPYLTTYWPQEVWEYDISATGELLAIKFVREHEIERKSMLDEKQYVQEIVYWYRDHWERYLISVPGPTPDGAGVNWNTGRFNRIVFEDSGPNPFVNPETGQGVVPVAFFRWDEALDGMNFTGQPQILALAQIARKHYNQQSELDYMMRSQVFGQLVGPINASGVQGAAQGTIQVGYGNFLPEPMDAIGCWRYISPDGKCADSYEKALDRNKNDGYRISLIDAGQGKQAETAEARKIRFQQTDAMLASAAENLDRWEQKLLRIVSYAFRLPADRVNKIVVRRKREYAIISLNDQIDGALKVLNLDIGVEATISIVTRMVLTQLPDISEAKSLEVQKQIRCEVTKRLGQIFEVSGDEKAIRALLKKLPWMPESDSDLDEVGADEETSEAIAEKFGQDAAMSPNRVLYEWVCLLDKGDDQIRVAVPPDKVAWLKQECEQRQLVLKPVRETTPAPAVNNANPFVADAEAPAQPDNEPASAGPSSATPPKAPAEKPSSAPPVKTRRRSNPNGGVRRRDSGD